MDRAVTLCIGRGLSSQPAGTGLSIYYITATFLVNKNIRLEATILKRRQNVRNSSYQEEKIFWERV
jgi:hypothetical protein